MGSSLSNNEVSTESHQTQQIRSERTLLEPSSQYLQPLTIEEKIERKKQIKLELPSLLITFYIKTRNLLYLFILFLLSKTSSNRSLWSFYLNDQASTFLKKFSCRDYLGSGTYSHVCSFSMANRYL